MWIPRFEEVRAQTTRLCEGLATEDYVPQSMPDCSPAKWHLAHTSWFFETFLLMGQPGGPAGLPGYRPFHPQFGYLFNSYYQSVGERHARPQRGLLTRPTVAEVYAYRAHVDQAMVTLLQRCAADAPLLPLLELGLSHEQQHQELLLTDLKHLFGQNPLRPAYAPGPPAAPAEGTPLGWHRYDAGLCWVGHGGAGFAFDNEGPRHQVYLDAFELASRPTTCAEYLAFIEDGGYQRPDCWLADGWDAVRTQGWEAPLYWERREGAWWQHTLRGLRPLGAAEPVCHLSLYEADAYARWREARLPTEAEWERAAATAPLQGNLLEGGQLHPAPLNAREDPPREHPAQLFGDVWEWTASAYAPYPGYRPPPGALGEYNGKFMCSQMVLRGGSCATPRSHLRASYRNFFPPAARWQFSGLRLARSLR